MQELKLLAVDIGSYAVLLALFVSVVSYRANPLRAFNRYFSLYVLLLAPWQFVVAMARTTKNFGLWAPLAAPFGGILPIILFLAHDSSLIPHDTIWRRLRRGTTVYLTCIVFYIGLIFATSYTGKRLAFPLSYRLVCACTIVLSIVTAMRRRNASRQVNPYEATLVNLTVFSYVFLITVYLLVRTPLGSRLISGGMVVFLLYTVYLLLNERIMDVQGTARVAVGHTLLFLIQISIAALTFSLLATFNNGTLDTFPVLLLGFVIIGVAYLFQAFVSPLTRNLFIPLSAKTAEDLRYEAVRVAATAENEHELTVALQTAAKRYLAGLDVQIVPYNRPPLASSTSLDARATLVAHTPDHGLTPDSATHRLKSPLLDTLLECFLREHLGAVLKHSSPHFTLVCFVHERAGGKKTITVHELGCLRELTVIAASGIDRIRATSENFRSRALAMIGQTHAFRSHQARNQLEPIRNLLEALTEGKFHAIPPHHIAAVYQQSVDLTADLEFALDLTRIDPTHTSFSEVDLTDLLQQTSQAAQRLTRANHTAILFECEDSLSLTTDPRLVRQILLNLIKNGVEAAAAVRAPAITLRARGSGNGVQIDVVDNGPGIRSEIHDQIFTPWITTKANGTGLGLTFCLACARALHGDLEYLTPIGQPNAHFRLTLPLQPAEAETIGRPVEEAKHGQ